MGLKELEIGCGQERPLENLIVEGKRALEGWEKAPLVKAMLCRHP